MRERAGLAFFYFAPTNSLVRIPIGTSDIPFIFEEVTNDFQKVTIQGQLNYRIADPRKISALFNFAMAPKGKDYAPDDPRKLPQRLINQAQVITRAWLEVVS